MAITNLGRVQLLFRGNWSSGYSYQYLDTVQLNGNSYVSLINNNIGNSPAEQGSTYWQLIAQKGATGTAAGFGAVTASAISLAPDSAATVSVSTSGGNSAKNFAFTFGIPQGATGETGAPASIISVIANATTTDYQSLASVAVSTSGSPSALGITFDFQIPQGTPGSQMNAVGRVDGIAPASSSDNVILKAVRYADYGTATTLTTAERAQARANISAMEAFSAYDNQVLKYNDGVWSAQFINEVPSGNASLNGYILRRTNDGYTWAQGAIPSGGAQNTILMKQSNTSYDVGWTSIISTSEIDAMFSS